MKFYSSLLFKLVAGVFLLELGLMLGLKYVSHCYGENLFVEISADTAILSFFMTGMFCFYLKKPLNKIINVLKAIKQEDFKLNCGVKGSGEMATLAMYVDEAVLKLGEVRDKEIAFNEELRATNTELQKTTDELQVFMAEQQAINAELEEAKAQIEKKYNELEEVYKTMLGREKRVLELKEENTLLKEELEKLRGPKKTQ